MLYRRTPNSHGIRVSLKARLHLVEHILVLPTGHPPLRARRAPFFQLAACSWSSSIGPTSCLFSKLMFWLDRPELADPAVD